MNNTKYDDFIETTGYGKIQGLCGINCRHTFSSFNPDLRTDDNDSIDYEENERRYRLTQRQRALERRIRELRREHEALKAGTDEEAKKARKAVKKKLEKKSDEYMDFCKDNDLKPRNWSLQTK